MIDSRHFRKLEKRVLDPKLAKLGFTVGKSRWGGRPYVRHFENQLHGIWVQLNWPSFRVEFQWHYDFLPSAVYSEPLEERLGRPLDLDDYVIHERAAAYMWGQLGHSWEIRDDEAEVEASLHEGTDLALQALDEIAQRFRDPRELLRLLPPRVFRYRVYDIDGSDKWVGDVGLDLLHWILGRNPFSGPKTLLEFLRLLAEHFGDGPLAAEYARAGEDLSLWFRLFKDSLPNERVLPVIGRAGAPVTARRSDQREKHD